MWNRICNKFWLEFGGSINNCNTRQIKVIFCWHCLTVSMLLVLNSFTNKRFMTKLSDLKSAFLRGHVSRPFWCWHCFRNGEIYFLHLYYAYLNVYNHPIVVYPLFFPCTSNFSWFFSSAFIQVTLATKNVAHDVLTM